LGSADIAKTRVGNRSSTTRAALQMVFQNPDSTLNPSHSVGFSLTRPLRLLRGMSRRDAKREAHRLAAQVNIPAEYLSAKPQQLSGGQKQRIAIARALAAHPSVVIADEPVSALDVSVQATIINLLEDLQQSEGISYILISHDVALVQHMSDWVVVIYKGIVVEQGPRDAVFQPPYHPYTAAMLTSAFGAPLNGEPVTLLEVSEGTGTSSVIGCPLFGRCPKGISGVCDVSSPPVRQLGGEHIIRCHLDLPAEASGYARLTVHRKEA
jgi:peptide/nickel transport system ATP-binding protein